MLESSALIVVRDGEDTIAEAIASALAEPIDEVLVVDDQSSDRTYEIVRSLSDSRLRVLRVPEHRTLGYARQFGLEAVRGEYCFLLDADDMFLPGRVVRLLDRLRGDDLDFVADQLELVDGVSGEPIRELRIPQFLACPPGLARLFERNFLPGIGQIAFQVQRMRTLGYDIALHGVEDSDLVYRALLDRFRGGLCFETGYRMRHFAGSVSRDRVGHTRALSFAMRKHDPIRVRSLLSENGMSGRLLDWAMVSFFMFRRQYREVAKLLYCLEAGDFEPEAVLDVDGPYPYPEKWRLDLMTGTLGLFEGAEASETAARLRAACDRLGSPVALNNLGVALWHLAKVDEARSLWELALERLPSYADARDNLFVKRASDLRITALPLRREATRSDY